MPEPAPLRKFAALRQRCAKGAANGSPKTKITRQYTAIKNSSCN